MFKALHNLLSGPAARLIGHLRTPLYRNGYALIFNSATTSILGIAYWVLAARYYSADDVGRNSAAIAATILLSSIAALYLDGALMRFIPQQHTGSGRLILIAYLISTAVGALVSLVFLVGIQFWSPALDFLNATTWSQIWFILATVTGTIFFLQDGALIGLRQAVWVPIENTTYSLVKLMLLVIFAQSFGEYGIFASWTLPAALLIFPVNYLVFRRFVRGRRATAVEGTKPLTAGQMVQYVAGNYISLLFLLGYTKLLPLMVIQEAGSKASAYFYLPWVIATSLQLVAQNMSASLLVEASLDESSLVKHLRASLIHTLRLLVPVCVLLALFAPMVLNIYGKAYAQESGWLLGLLVLAVIPNAVVTLFIALSRVQRRTGRVIAVHGILAVFVVALSYFLLPLYGITGIGIAWLTTQTAMAAFLLLSYLRPILIRRETEGHRVQKHVSSPAE